MNVVLYFQPTHGICSPQKLAGVVDTAEKIRWNVQVVRGFPTPARFRGLAELWQPAGVIAECGDDRGNLDPKAFNGLPTVLLCGNHQLAAPNVVCVSHDNAATAQSAAKELLRTGMENFAFIPDRNGLEWSRQRGKSFADTIALNGRTCRSFRCPSTDPTERQRLLRGFLMGLRRPCAVFAANDETAAETIAAARHLGISVPDQLAVLGVDNDEAICEHTQPRLSSVEPDFREGGRMAMLMLVALARSGRRFVGLRQRFFGPWRVVRRESTLRLNTYDRSVIEMLEFIRREACNGLTAKAVAARCPRSRPITDARFQAATGHSILAEIHAVQLETAQRLLSNPKQQLGAIADFCGFKNPNSLRKFFRRETGMTMSAWRRLHAAAP